MDDENPPLAAGSASLVFLPRNMTPALQRKGRDMDENTTAALLAMGVALAIFAIVIFTLPMPPKRRRH